MYISWVHKTLGQDGLNNKVILYFNIFLVRSLLFSILCPPCVGTFWCNVLEGNVQGWSPHMHFNWSCTLCELFTFSGAFHKKTFNFTISWWYAIQALVRTLYSKLTYFGHISIWDCILSLRVTSRDSCLQFCILFHKNIRPIQRY